MHSLLGAVNIRQTTQQASKNDEDFRTVMDRDSQLLESLNLKKKPTGLFPARGLESETKF
jgi:hypothetical protein